YFVQVRSHPARHAPHTIADFTDLPIGSSESSVLHGEIEGLRCGQITVVFVHIKAIQLKIFGWLPPGWFHVIRSFTRQSFLLPLPPLIRILMSLEQEIAKRRTFGIISHPDAGKTTLTEKLLLFGGAIQKAGAVKSSKIRDHVRSDWMEIEKQRGISVATSVMGFNYGDSKINLLDTPGHQDFAEDTYRTLT